MVALLCLLLADTAAVDQQKHATVRVFLDCGRCDDDYLRKEVTFIDYVRNREDADVHVLVSTQDTGGGGTQFTLKFIGLGSFHGVDQTLTYNSLPTATPDETRSGFAEVFRLGLVRYAAETSLADRLRVTFKKAEGTAAAAKAHDPWNYWVFRLNAGGNFNGEQSSTGRQIRGSFSANRTTDDWRMAFSGSANYRENTFVLDDETTLLSVSRNMNADGLVVKSLTPHWSFGAMASAESSTFRNYSLRARVAPGIEYDIFPYA